MEISLSEEHAYYFVPQLSPEIARDRIEKKKTMLVAGLLGDIRSGGKKWSDQIKGILTRELFFDVTADAVGMIVPGRGIAVKSVKAVVDRNKK